MKRTTGPGLRAARRELAAYRTGIASPTAATGLRAPALVGCVDEADRIELWLEALTDHHAGVWNVERFALAAEHIGAWDAEASRTRVPRDFDAEDAWAERHGQPERVEEALAELGALSTAPDATTLMDLLGDHGFDRTAALIASTTARIERLSAFPQTLLHHDLVRSNLFALSASSTAAIDWENVGRGPLGVDLAPLVIGSVRRGEASADDLEELEREVLRSYEVGLATAGIVPGDVRTAYRLAVGLRWHTVLGTIRVWLDPTGRPMRGSRPEESRTESLRQLVGLSRHILDVGDLPAE